MYATYLFAFFSLLGPSPANVALAVLTLAFLWDCRTWRGLGRDPLVRVCLAFGIYVAAHSLAVYLTAPAPELAAAAADTGPSWLKLLLFIPFAYWVGGSAQRIGWVLLLALIGFVIGILRKIDWGSFGSDFFHERFEVYLPAIAFGMFTALGALGLIALREWFWASTRGEGIRWARIAGWLVLLTMMLEGLFLSYSRGSWIAFAVAVLLLVLLEWREWRLRAGGRAALIVSGLLVAGAVATFLLSQSDRIAERMLTEKDTAARVIGGEWSEVPSSPVGVRVHALSFAAELWRERPWLGWGAGSSRYLIAHSNRPESLMYDDYWLPHLHNAYAEILVQLGLVGFVLASAILWLLVKEVAAERRAGGMPDALPRFLLVSMVCVLIWNLTNYRIIRHDWISFWILFAGIGFSFRMRTLTERSQQRPLPGADGREA